MTGAIEDIWISVAVGLFVVALFALALLVPRRVQPARSADVKLDDVKTRLDEVERRQRQADHDLRNVRMTVAGLATKDSVNAVALSVAEMRGEVKGLVSNVAATGRGVERIEDFLMKSTAEAIASAKGAEGRS
ncbi:hypothetical protein [Methylobacterium sp. SyP6R]|uniref:hypothetical protein n=1 Tax=Methylobacterium sp. SyP6R TaxID=2718876 RepID=UPI001F1E59BA|nr:hypothetical protein [Methylobacterium sp. SyP6R]MCF4125027.1 hypothetical protein [Methylobacterium sp. SyP6R]